MSYGRLVYRPIQNPDQSHCYIITPIQLLISSKTLRDNAEKFNDPRLQPLKFYNDDAWWRTEFSKWCKWFENENVDGVANGGDPEYVLSCFLLPAIKSILDDEVMTTILGEIGYSRECVRVSYPYNPKYMDDFNNFVNYAMNVTITSSSEVSCWLANIYTKSGIHHAVNIAYVDNGIVQDFAINDNNIQKGISGKYYVVIDEDRIITTLDDWVAAHEDRIDRIDIVGYGSVIDYIARAFGLEATPSIHKYQFRFGTPMMYLKNVKIIGIIAMALMSLIVIIMIVVLLPSRMSSNAKPAKSTVQP